MAENKISEVIEEYLALVAAARSARTAATYRNALNAYQRFLEDQDKDPQQLPITNVTEDHILWLASTLKAFSPATERLYLTAFMGFLQFLAAEKRSEINLPRARLLILQRARRPGVRLPQFPADSIEQVLSYIQEDHWKLDDLLEHIIYLRDRAFLLTLADTGLRVHEACALRRGDLDWNEAKAVVIGKGNREDIVRFSNRATTALRAYLQSRTAWENKTGKPLASLPLFARHDKGTGGKIKPITTTTGRNIVAARIREALGDEAVGSITPHSFRHYFVTRVLRSSGNLKLAQELARHRNIAVTQRYAHISDDELDKGYYQAIEE